MKRGVLIIVAVVFLILFGVVAFLIARGGKKTSSDKPVLSIWAPFDEKKAYEEISKNFFLNRQDATFEFRYIQAKDAKDYEAKVVDAIASGAGPDIWLARTDWLPKHEAKLVSAPDTLEWKVEQKVEKKDVLKTFLGEKVLAQNSRSGRLYGLPLSVDSLALYINNNVISQVTTELGEATDPQEAVFEAPPKTWADLELWNKLITRQDRGGFTRSGIALGTIDNAYAPVDVYLAMLRQRAGSLYDSTDKEVALHLTTDAASPARDALDYFASFAKAGNANYSWNAAAGDPVRRFVENKVGMMIGFSSLRFDIYNLDRNFTNYSIAPLPQIKDPKLPTESRVDYAAYWTHVVSKTSDMPQLAWQYLQYLTEESVQGSYNRLTLKPTLDMIDGNGEVTDSEAVASPQQFATQVAFSGAVYKPEWQFVDETLQTMIRAVTVSGEAAQVAVDTAAAKLKAGQ